MNLITRDKKITRIKPEEVSQGAKLHVFLKRIPSITWFRIGVLLVAMLILFCYLLQRESSTNIELNLKVSSLGWRVVNAPVNKNKLEDFRIDCDFSNAIYLDKVQFTSGILTDSIPGSYAIAATGSDKNLQFSSISFPTGCSIMMEMLPGNVLKLLQQPVSSDTLAWNATIGFSQASIYNYEGNNLRHINSKENKISVERKYFQGQQFNILFDKPAAWKWPSQLYVTDLVFSESNNTGPNDESSVLSGQITLLNTTSPPIELKEKDILRVRFIDSVELFLAGDSSGITVRVMGRAKQIYAGPRVMGDDNNRMPLRIEVLNDKGSYVWTVLSTLIGILAFIPLKLKPATQVLFVMLVLPLFANTQIIQNKDYRNNTVSIAAGGDQGAGFFCGSTKDSVYVITAAHVVRPAWQQNNEIWVSFSGDSTRASVLHCFDSSEVIYDIAILSIPNRRWQSGSCLYVTANSNLNDLFFYRNGESKPLPIITPAFFTSWESDEHEAYSIYLPEIKKGDSGSGLFCNKGLAGMIIDKFSPYGLVLSAGHIRNVVHKLYPGIWQIRLSSL
jgi:hypothetical protein